MRFNSPDDVKKAAEKFAADIVNRHRENGHDVNPYCTPGARAEFDRAFCDLPRRSWDGPIEWDFRYQTGRAVAELLKG